MATRVRAWFVLGALLFFCGTALAQAVEVTATPLDADPKPTPEVGRQAADKYMEARPGPKDHYMAVHFGTFVTSQSYEWGEKGGQKDPGRANFGVTYRIGEWVNTFDLMLRADFSMYGLPKADPFKLSVVPLIIFPDSASRFPLYFGAGIGPGVYFDQVQGQSRASIDYQLIAGLRFFGLYKTTGVSIETGLKNHVHLTTDGQFNGVFVSVGGVFAF